MKCPSRLSAHLHKAAFPPDHYLSSFCIPYPKSRGKTCLACLNSSCQIDFCLVHGPPCTETHTALRPDSESSCEGEKGAGSHGHFSPSTSRLHWAPGDTSRQRQPDTRLWGMIQKLCKRDFLKQLYNRPRQPHFQTDVCSRGIPRGILLTF